MKIHRWLASVLVGLLAAGGLTVAVAAPASANYTDITCTTAWLEPHRDLRNGDHINIDISKDGRKFQASATVTRNIQGGWQGLGLRVQVDGVAKGPFPLTKQEVQSGRLTFNYGQFISDQFTVEWAQFNNSYFNQDRKLGKFFTCGTPPTPKDANAEIVTTPASCEANGTASWSNLVHATGATLDQTPGSRSGIATSAQGHLFADGQNTKTVPYVIEHKLDPNAPPCFVKPPQPESLKGTDQGSYPPVCVEPKDGTSTTTSWTQDWTQAYVWSDETRTWVLGGKVYAPKVETTGDPVKNPDCKPAPATPKATIEATCGLATVALSNGVRQGLTASFVIFVDGKFYDAYSVAAGAESEVVKITFGEDTGTHVVEVFQAGTSEWKSIAKAKVESDCIPPQPADKKGTEERTLEPVCVDPADGTATVVAQERSWTQTAAWDGKEWVYGAKVYGEWEVVSTSTEPNADCAPPTREPREEITYGEWVGGEPTCEDTEVTQTRTVTVTTTTYGWEFQEGEWVETSASSSSIGEPETRVVKWEGEACPTPTPTQTPTPTTTPTPTPTVPPVSTDDELPPTGGEIVGTLIAGAFGVAALAGGIVLLIRRRQTS